MLSKRETQKRVGGLPITLTSCDASYVSRGRDDWSFVPAVTAPEAQQLRAIRPVIGLGELVQDTIDVHGHAWAAAHYSKRMCFVHFYYFAFGRLPLAHSSGTPEFGRLPR